MHRSERYDSLFQYYGEKYAVDWRLLKVQVKAESNFNPDARSKAGARGLAQFMARTWEEWRDGLPGVQEPPPADLVLLDPRDPEDAIAAQAAYMAWLLKLLDGNECQALAAYNWGIGRMLKIRKARDWRTRLPQETKNYVAKIAKDREVGQIVAVG